MPTTFSANRLQYTSNATKLQVSTQLFDRALLNRNGVMDIWNMPRVRGRGKVLLWEEEYTEVSELNNSNERAAEFSYSKYRRRGGARGQTTEREKNRTKSEPKKPPDDGKQKEGVNNAD